jgi:intracellular septation protein A
LSDDQGKVEGAQGRLTGFAKHLAAYFIVMIICGAVNLINSPETLWVSFLMLGWSPALALHAAYAMGMFTSSDK